MRSNRPEPPVTYGILNRRTLLGGAGAGAFVLLASGCGLINGGRGSDEANALAQALSNHDVSGVNFDGATGAQAQEQFDRIVANMNGTDWTVEVDSLAEIADDGSREATLAWTWEIPGAEAPWKYQSTVTLSPDGNDNWQPVWSPTLFEPSLQDDEGLALTKARAERGAIIGANDQVIVAKRPVYRIGLDLSQLQESQKAAAARELAAVVDIDADTYVDTVEAAGENQFVPAITLREDAYRDLDAARTATIPGFTAAEDTMALAPTSTFAASTLGRVSDVTAEDIDASDGELSAGDQIGRGGLQAAFNDRLAGTDGVLVTVSPLDDDGAPATGGRTRTVFETEATAGQDLRITLDQKLQAAAEKVLEDVESPSAIVAIRPSDGHILALADGAAAEGYPTAAQGQYAPGSTFKVVTSLAMVRLGDTMESTVNCTNAITVDGARFGNAPGYSTEFIGEIPIKDALAQSCNTAFISQYDRVDQPALAEAAHSLGLGQEWDLGIDAFSGTMPDEESGAAHAAALFGQGRTLVSPLTMATITASVVAGHTVAPVLVTDDAPSSTPSPTKALTQEEADQLRTGMREVVATGHLKNLRTLSPDTTIGKTGTAEYGNDDPPKTHAWIIAAHEDLAISVFVEEGELGSITGGPLALEFLEAAQK